MPSAPNGGPQRGVWRQEEDTALFGAMLATRSQPGDCIALVGAMGAGKTTLARAIATGCGVLVAEEFCSPTYTYANEYAGSPPVIHLDLYRVADAETAESLGLVELCARTDALILVEWPDRLPDLIPAEALWLSIGNGPDKQHGEHARTWQARGPKKVLQRLLAPPAQPNASPLWPT